MSEGWAYPLKGFMNEDEYLQCLHFNSIKVDGKIYNQSIPIVLSCNEQDQQALKSSKATQVCLTYQSKPVGVISNLSIFPHRKIERCARQFGLNHSGHPYQTYVMEECGDWLLGGSLEVFERIKWNDGLDEHRLTPLELRQRFQQIKVS